MNAAASPDHTLLSTDFVGSLAEDSAMQIMSDLTTVAVACKDLSTESSTLGVFLLTDKKKLEDNVSNIDLSYLNEGIIPDPSNENLNFLPEQQLTVERNSAKEGDVVMIDVTKPIQLSQNSLIMVDGQKCVLQHNPQTGQVVAYPVKEQGRRRRGRPRKTWVEPSFANTTEKDPAPERESFSEEEQEKGLQEVVNDDGSLVRRSSRKRKKAKVLKDYETGNLQQELGSDVEDSEQLSRKRRPKSSGKPPRKWAESISPKDSTTQAFLVQTADGQTLMLQVPLSSIPEGTTLQEMAHHIADKLNGQAEKSCAEDTPLLEPALQDHSVGSTTPFNIDIIGEEICESQEMALQCDQNLNVLEDQFCLDVSSTTAVDGASAAAMLCHLVDYAAKPDSPERMDFQVQGPVVDPKLDDPSPDPIFTALEKEGTTSVNKAAEALLQESLTGETSPVVTPSGPKKCKICTVPYFTEEEIVQHFKDKHPKCICSECDYMNEHPYGIKRHSYRHVREEWVCNICNKKYKDSYILKMHVKMVHLPPEVLFQCEVCGKEFTRKAHLKRHQRTHAPVKQYRCQLCDYQGCEKSDVTKHSLIHEEPKFKCEFCGKAFRHLKNRELHVKRHSGQRDYKCAACNFYGYTYTDIRKHIKRRHSSKEVFPELCKE